MQTLIARLNRATASAMAAVECSDAFAEGASAQALAQLEQDLNVVLPEDFKQWYLAHNGDATEQQFYVLAGHDWLNVEEMHTAWQALCEACQGYDLADEGFTDNDDGVRPVMWSRRWLPFAEDNGYYLLLDLDPAPTGTYGQILVLSGDGDPVSLQAASIRQWLEEYVTGLEQGLWVFSEDYRGMIRADELAQYAQTEHDRVLQTGLYAPEAVAEPREQEAAFQAHIDDLVAQVVPKGSALDTFIQELKQDHAARKKAAGKDTE